MMDFSIKNQSNEEYSKQEVLNKNNQWGSSQSLFSSTLKSFSSLIFGGQNPVQKKIDETKVSIFTLENEDNIYKNWIQIEVEAKQANETIDLDGPENDELENDWVEVEIGVKDEELEESLALIDRQMEKEKQAEQAAQEGIEKERKELSSCELLPIPQDGIRKGLPNLGNVCWFSSLLKLLSKSDIFHPLLLKAEGKDSEQQEAIKKELRFAVNKLRGESSQFDSFTYGSIVEKLREDDFLGRFFNRETQDPVDFLMNLSLALNLFCQPEEGSPKKMEFFTSLENEEVKVKKAPRESGDRGWLESISLTEKMRNLDKINLDEALQDPSEIEARSDGASDSEKNHRFLKKIGYTFLPDQLIVQLRRAVLGDIEGDIESNAKKIEAPIELNEENLVEITQYKEENGSLIPEKRCFYQIDFAVVHQGNKNTVQHYFCVERTPGNEFIKHDDSIVKTLGEFEALEFLSKGTIFQLSKVREEKVGSVSVAAHETKSLI